MMSVLLKKLARVLPWGLTALAAILLIVLRMLPAAWFAPAIARATAGRVHFSAPAGSVWRGSATLMLAAGPNAQALTVLPGRIEWRTAFWPLCTGRLRILLRLSEAMPAAVELIISPRRASLSSGRLSAPASLLAGLGAPFNTLDLQGEVRLEWSAWRVFGNRPFGELTLNLHDMTSRVARVKPLGSYHIVIQASGRRASLVLTTTKGPLLLDGRGRWQDRAVFFQGTARAQAAERENLRGLLMLLGRPIDDQTYALSLSL